MEIKEKIRFGESRTLEFKEAFPSAKAIAKTAVAFSNDAGGDILIGVNDKGLIVGVDEDEIITLPDRISDIIHSLCHPMIVPDIFVENIDDKNIVVIRVFPGSLTPYFLKSEGKINGTYIRIGAENKKADNEFVFDLERKRRNIGFDEEINYDYPLKDISVDFIHEIFQKKCGKEINEEYLFNLNLIKKENGKKYPTNALIILSGMFENTRTDCARFKGTTVQSFIDKKEYSSDLFTQIDQIEMFLKNHLNLNAKIEGFKRTDQYEIPLEALREAILNAFIHRNYSRMGTNIKIAVFDDIVEITSPGVLPASINLYDIFNSRRSEVRNKTLARIFKELGYIEQWGSGMRKIHDYCKSVHLKTPEIAEKGHFLQITFFRSIDNTPINTDNTPINTDNLQNHEENIIIYLKADYKITNKKARELTNLSDNGVKSLFRRMIEKDLLEKHGQKRGTFYTLKEKK